MTKHKKGTMEKNEIKNIIIIELLFCWVSLLTDLAHVQTCAYKRIFNLGQEKSHTISFEQKIPIKFENTRCGLFSVVYSVLETVTD